MSDVIPTPGKYKQQNGKPAEVKWVGEGKAIGFDSSGDLALWQAVTGRWGTDTEREDFPWNITGPWIPDPPEPPAGFVVMPKDYVAKRGDLMCHDLYHSWQRVENSIGKTSEQIEEGDPDVAPVFIASPIPKPAVDPGEGWRLLESGEVIATTDEYWHEGGGKWLPTFDAHCRWNSYGIILPHRRRVVPQPEWTPTNELRWKGTTGLRSSATGFNVTCNIVLEQKWTNGTDSEWRPVTVEGA